MRLINRQNSNADSLPLLYESSQPQCRAYPDERVRPLEGTYLPSCLRTDGRRAAQPVGSFVTNALRKPSLVVSKAPGGVVEGGGEPRHVGTARCVHRDGVTDIGIGSSKEGGVVELGVDHTLTFS